MTVYQADIFEALPTIAENAFDLVVADPDYGWKSEQHARLWDESRKISNNWLIIYGDKAGLLKGIYPPPDQLVVWVKPMSSKFPKYKYYSRHEYIYFWGNGEFPEDTHSSQYSDVWEDLPDKKGHKWRKPLSQMQRILRHHTDLSSFVLDVCAGSAPMQEACALYNRPYTGLEIDEQWCESVWINELTSQTFTMEEQE